MYLKKCIRFVSCLGADCTTVSDLVSFPTALTETVVSRGDDLLETPLSNRGRFPSTVDTQNSSSQAQSKAKLIVQNALITMLPPSIEEVSGNVHPVEGCNFLKSECTYNVQHYDEITTNTARFNHSLRLFPTIKEQEVGDCHEPIDMDDIVDSVTCRGENECLTSRPNVAFSSCPDVSSTSMQMESQAVSNTTLAGLQWCPLETEITVSGSLVMIGRSDNVFTCENELERPLVPMEFSVGRTSDVLFSRQPSMSMEDIQVGCTSTTHEIRWTLLEQEQLIVSERSGRLSTVDTMCRTMHIRGQPKHFRKSNRLRVDHMYDGNAPGCYRKGGPHINSTKVNSGQAHVRRLATPVSPDNSSPMATDEVPVTLFSLNDISSHFSPTPAPRSLAMSPLRMMRPDNPLPGLYTADADTAMSVRPTLTPLSSSIAPCTQRVFSMTSPLPIHMHGEREDEVHMQPLYLSYLAPIGSEPPLALIRHSVCSVQSVDPLPMMTDSPQIMKVIDGPIVTTRQSGKHVRLQSIAKLITSNIASYRQPVVEFVPLEKVRYAQSPVVTHKHRFGKLANSDSIDLNGSECSEHKTDSLGDQCRDRFVAGNGMKCAYVEVTFRRNLDGMLAPTSLSKSESKIVLIRLDRKLRSVVVRHFRHCYAKKSRCRSLSPTDQSTSLERPGKKLSPCSTEKRSCSALESIISRTTSTRLKHLLPNGAVVNPLASGPRLVRPPRQWWEHIQSVEQSTDSGRMLAWEIDPLHLTIGALINFRHHLEILVSSNDGRLGIAYTNAVSLLNEMFGRETRCIDGKVTSKGDCCQSLMSVQVHVKSPVLANFLACTQFDVSAIVGLDKLGLSIRGVSKRSAVSDKPVRLNTISVYTKEGSDTVEYRLLHRIFTGIKRLRTIEQELLLYSPFSSKLLPEICPVETIGYLTEQIVALPGNPESYIQEYLTSFAGKEVLTRKTDYGGTLAHCIRDSAYCPTVRCPRAVDPHCYEAFSSLFSPILKDIRKSVCLSERQLNPVDDLTRPRIPNVFRYHVTFMRNLEGFAFPPLLTRSDYLKIEKICKGAIISWTEAKGFAGNWYSLADMYEEHPALCKQLIKKGLLMPADTPDSVFGGVCRHWPEGRSLFVSSGGGQFSVDLVVQLNFDDHVRVVSVDWSGRQPRTAYRKAANLIQWLDKQLSFCTHAKLGFLAPSPYHVGTGMHISAQIKLVHLGKRMAELEALCQRLNLSLLPNEEGCGLSSGTVFTAVLRGALGQPKACLAAMFMNSLMCLQKADTR